MRILGRIVAFSMLGFALAAGASTVPSTTTFYFTGNCTDCSNDEGVLVLQDYSFGAPLDPSNVVSFTYTSSVVGTQSTGENPQFVSGSLGSVAGPYVFQIGFADNYFMDSSSFNLSTNADGTWRVFGSGPVFDYGTNGVWSLTAPSATPEPGSLALLATGMLGGAGMVRRRLVR